MESFNPTTKTQQAISAAAQAAALAGNPDVGPTHLLGALLAQGDGIAAPLLAAVGADVAAVRAEVTQLGNRLPSAAGSTVGAPQLSREALAAITAAQQLATEMGDEYVSTEHLLVGLAEKGGQVAQLLRRHGALVVGKTIRETVFRSIVLRDNARVHLDAIRLGEPSTLTPREMEISNSLHESPRIVERARPAAHHARDAIVGLVPDARAGRGAAHDFERREHLRGCDR